MAKGSKQIGSAHIAIYPKFVTDFTGQVSRYGQKACLAMNKVLENNPISPKINTASFGMIDDAMLGFRRQVAAVTTAVNKDLSNGFSVSAKNIDLTGKGFKDASNSAQQFSNNLKKAYSGSEKFAGYSGKFTAPIASGFQGVGSEADAASRRVGSLGWKIAGLSLAVSAINTVKNAFGSIIRTGITAYNANEQARVSFTTLLGSGEKANAMIKNMQEFAAKTPFSFRGLQGFSTQLIAAGVESNKVIPIMKTLGNVTSGMGYGEEAIGRAILALQQMNAAQKINGQDLMQLRNAGIPVYDLLAAALGKTKEEVAKLANKGKLGKDALDKMMEALETGKGLEKFNGMMDNMSGTLQGKWSNLQDNFEVFAGKLVKLFEPIAKDVFGALSSALDWLQPKLDAVSQWAKEHPTAFKVIAGILATLATAFTILTVAIGITMAIQLVATPIAGAFTAVMGALSAILGALFSPIGIAIMAIVALVAAFIYLWNNCETFRNVFIDIWEAIKGAVVAVANWFTGTLVPTVVGVFNAIASTLSGLGSSICGAFVGAWNAAKNATSNGISAVVNFVSGLPGKIVNVFSGAGSILYNAGRDIVNGLLNGVSSLAGRIGSYFLDKIPSWIREPFKAALGIASPSKVFMQYGRFTGEGFAIGLGKEEANVRAASAGLAEAAMLDMKLSEANTSYTNNATTASGVLSGLAGLAITGRLEIGGDGLARIIDGQIVGALDSQAARLGMMRA